MEKNFRTIFIHSQKDPIISTTKPYGDTGEVKLMTLDNFPEIHPIRAFIGTSFNVGVWEPRINLGSLYKAMVLH